MSEAVTAQTPSSTEILLPGQFRFVTKALAAYNDPGVDSRRRFKMIASSTVTDRQGDEITLAALEKMRDHIRKGMTIFLNHRPNGAHEIPEDIFGVTDSAEIVKAGMEDGNPIYELHAAGDVDVTNPRAVKTADSIAGGYAQLGASIEAAVINPVRKSTGRYKIDDIDLHAAAIVGVPANQRSWVQKAVGAAQMLDPIVETEDEECEACAETAQKGDLSARARHDLPESEFACPEKRKYPINDAAHVRAALSRIADPSNDQCGRDKIMAAARRLGIGDHDKAAPEGDLPGPVEDELSLSKADGEPAVIEKSGCPSCGGAKGSPKGDCNDAYHSTTMKADADGDADSKSVAAEAPITPSVITGGQESGAESPESAPAESESGETVPATEQKVAAISADDYQAIVKGIEAAKSKLATVTAQRDAARAEAAGLKVQLAKANEGIELARTTFAKIMAQPLRPRTADTAVDFAEKFAGYDPRIREMLTKGETTP